MNIYDSIQILSIQYTYKNLHAMTYKQAQNRSIC